MLNYTTTPPNSTVDNVPIPLENFSSQDPSPNSSKQKLSKYNLSGDDGQRELPICQANLQNIYPKISIHICPPACRFETESRKKLASEIFMQEEKTYKITQKKLLYSSFI